jgi:Zn-dependent protease with chaperone function
MDFFDSQDAARRKTKYLVIYFVLAVAGMIGLLYLVMVSLSVATRLKSGATMSTTSIGWWQPETLLYAAGGTILVVALGSLYKMGQLRHGGDVVAESLGGRRLNPGTTDLAERRLLNVVEEMALAAGTPVPPVYLLDDERSINAFAAGHTPGDAVIGINRGTLDQLSRDELQGVIAHEFSHILNGDMRLNLRLMGVLHGILLFAIVGYYAMRVAGAGGGRSHRRSNNGKSEGGGQFLIIGLAMMAIGYIGLFFARLIKAAVSRQREYLADASAVQFTRNPSGISGALKKIGALPLHSTMLSPAAESTSHMFFGLSRNSHVQLMSTHPPLVDRIQRVDPSFSGDFSTVQLAPLQPAKPPKPKPAKGATAAHPALGALGSLGAVGGMGGGAMSAGGMGGANSPIPMSAVVVAAMVGTPTSEHIRYAHDLLSGLPAEVLQAVRDSFSARAVVLALLLDDDSDIRAKQLDAATAALGEPTTREIVNLAPLIDAQGAEARLPLAELVQPALQGLSPDQYKSFRNTVRDFVKADGKIDMFEFCLQRILIGRLDRHFSGAKPPISNYSSVNGLIKEFRELLSILAHFGSDDPATATLAFDRASAAIAARTPMKLKPRDECSLKLVGKALDKLALASPIIKKRILKAAAIAVTTDGFVTLKEGELLRTIADSLDCPMPPLNPGG